MVQTLLQTLRIVAQYSGPSLHVGSEDNAR
jgi:hypothetical protein